MKEINFKHVVKSITSHLTFWVLAAIVAGILLGHFAPTVALQPVLNSDWKGHFLGQELKIGKTLSECLSGIFISTVKLFINPIIFLTITLGIVSMGDLKKVGKLGAKAVLYFEIVTTVALLIGVLIAHIIRPGDRLEVQSLGGGDISPYQKGASEFSWGKFLMDNSTLQVLILAILVGIGLSFYKKRAIVIEQFTMLSKYIFKDSICGKPLYFCIKYESFKNFKKFF